MFAGLPSFGSKYVVRTAANLRKYIHIPSNRSRLSETALDFKAIRTDGLVGLIGPNRVLQAQ